MRIFLPHNFFFSCKTKHVKMGQSILWEEALPLEGELNTATRAVGTLCVPVTGRIEGLKPESSVLVLGSTMVCVYV